MCVTPFIISVIYNTEHFELLRSRCVYNAVRTFSYYYIFILYFYRTSFFALFNRIFTFRSKIFFISYTVSLHHLSISINETRLVERNSTFIMLQKKKNLLLDATDKISNKIPYDAIVYFTSRHFSIYTFATIFQVKFSNLLFRTNRGINKKISQKLRKFLHRDVSYSN